MSFDVVEPIEWGLAYDNNIKKIDTDKVYNEGRYLIGLGRSFIIFPRTYQTIRYGSTFDDADGGARPACARVSLTISARARARRRHRLPDERRSSCVARGVVPVSGASRAQTPCAPGVCFVVCCS